MQVNTEILEAFAGAINVPNTEPLDKWCKHNVFLPSPPFNPGGLLDLKSSPYLIQPLLDLQNPKIREVVAVGNPRSGKTLISQAFTLYTINEDPADILLAVHKKDAIKSFYDVRILPLLKANDVKFNDERFSTTQRLIKFRIGSMKLTGAQTAADFTQLGHRVLIGDELHEWKPGMLEIFKRRADEYRYTKKILLISSASDSHTDLHKEWLKGNQAIWGFKCPHCQLEQVYHFTFKRPDGVYAGFRFDEIKNEKGEWDIVTSSATSRYECIGCLHKFYDNDKDRRQLNDCGLYIPQNPNADASIRSYSWNAFSTRNISYESITTAFLNAKKDVERNKYEDIASFHRDVLSKFYHQGMTDEKVELNVDSTGEDGPDGLRFIGVDVQKYSLYYVILAYFKETKTVRLVTYGKTAPDNWGEIEKIRTDNRVGNRNVLVDAGSGMATEVYRQCAAQKKEYIDAVSKQKKIAGWLATKGDEPADGHYYHPKDKKYRLYSPIKKQEVASADKQAKTFCGLTVFYSSAVRSVLQELIENKHPYWKLYFTDEAKNDPVFNAHLNADKLSTVVSKRSNKVLQRWVNPDREDNHWADAMNLATLAGIIVGYL